MKLPTSNAKSLDGIRVRKQNRNLNSTELRKFVAMDDNQTKFAIRLQSSSNSRCGFVKTT